MSYTDLQSKIEALGAITNNKLVSLSPTFVGSAELTAMFQDAFGVDTLGIRGQYAEIDPETGIRITGYVDLWERTDWECDLRITEQDAGYRFVLKLLVPGEWTWSESFPEIPVLMDVEGDDARLLTIMDYFQLGTSWLVFTNETHESALLEMDLVAGLNFTGELKLGGKLGRLADIGGLDVFMPFQGPVKEYLGANAEVRFSGIRLSAPLPLNIDPGSMTVESGGLLLKSPVRESDKQFAEGLLAEPGIYCLLDVEVDGRPLRVVGNYNPMESGFLSFEGFFTDFAVGGLNMLDGAVGGSDLQTSIPSDLGAPTGIQVTSFGFELDTRSKKPTMVHLGLGCGNAWDLVPGWLRLTQIGLDFSIYNPFVSNKRRLAVEVAGVLEVAGKGLEFSVEYPSLDFVVQKRLQDTLSLGELLGALAPGLGNVPALKVEGLRVQGSATEKMALLSGRVSELAEVPVGNAVLKFERLSFYANYLREGTSDGFVQGEFSLGEAKAVFQAVIGTETILSGTLSNISLHQLYGEITGATDIPDEVPDLSFSSLSLSYNLTTGAVRFVGSADFAYDKLPFDSSISTHAEFTLVKAVATGAPTSYTIGLSLSGTGPVEFASGYTLESFALSFAYNTTAGWSLGGTVATKIAGAAVSLTASYITSPTGKKLSLSAAANDSPKILSFSGLFHLSWSRIDLTLEKTVVEGKPDQKSWGLRLDSKLSIPSVSTFDTSAEFAADSNGNRSLKFKPKTVKAYNLAIADGIGVAFKPKEVSLARDVVNNNWSLVGMADLGITGVTGKLGKALPTSFVATLSLSKTATKVEMLNPMNPIDFPLPKADGQSLGKFVLQIMKIGVSLKPTVGFTAQLGLGFPKELNTYFKRQVFREYEAGNPMSMALLDCTVASTGIGLQFTTSPFLSGNTTKAENGEDWINFDFGDCGEIAMKMPSFKYNMASSYFEASGGFKIVRDLSLPLTPLRNFLDGVGMGAAKAIFPEKLPIKGISLVDENDNFKTEDLITMLGDVPNDVKSALRGAGNLLNRFPDGFKSYLKFEIPTELSFKFGFSPLGRVSFALSAPVEPIRFLYPGMVQGLVPMPGLIGIELRKLNIGTLASGSLFFGDIDAVIDMYDLPSLVTSLALPTDPGFPLPTSDQLQRRIILKNVFSIIPLSQGVPVPVPVFHDEIGFEYMGLEGIGIQAHMGIPQPDFAAGGTELLKTLVTFFKDRSYKLDPNKAPGGQQIKFRFRDEYLQAPEYLGGGKVGTSDTVIEIGTWKYVAQLMNFCKRFALEHLIASVPLENRMANKSTKLAFFEVDGQYLITTPEEFDSGAYTALGLNADQRQDFRDVLPGVQTGSTGAGNGSSGLVMFLRGAVKAGSIFEMQACYGLAISGTMGFNTGFKFEGKVGGFVEAEIRGALLLNAKDVSGSPSYPVATPVAKPAELPPAPRRFGGKALQLDGVSSCIEIPYVDAMDLTDYTIEMWVNLEKPTADWVGLFGRTEGNFAITLSKTGEIYTYEHSTAQPMHFTCDTSSRAFVFGKWQHIAYARKGKWNFIYINGAFGSSYAPWDDPRVADKTSVWVGKPLGGNVKGYAKGQILDLRIWKRFRTEAEIASDYQRYLTGQEASLVANYPLDHDNGAQALDICGNLTAKLVSCKYVTATAPILPTVPGIALNGGQDHIAIRQFTGLDWSKFTIRLRMRYNYQGKSDPMFTSSVGGLTFNSIFRPDGANTNVPLESDKVVALTIVGEGKTRRYYLGTSIVNTVNMTGSLPTTPVDFFIGRNYNGTAGTIDATVVDLHIWNEPKSSNWIRQNHENSLPATDPNTLARWDFDAMHEGVLLSQPGRYQATGPVRMASTAVFPSTLPLMPKGLQFQHPSQYAVVPTTSKLDLTAYTVEMWFRPEVIDGEVRFLTRFLNGNPRIATVSGAVEHRWLDEAGTYYSISARNSLIPKGKWSHIAATHDGLVGKIYINGVLAASKTSAKPLMHKATEIIIGRNTTTDQGGNLNGSLDELRIWSLVRTDTEIRAGMERALVGNESGLVAYYPMDPLGSQQLVDRGPHGLHGTVVGISPVISTPAAGPRCAVQAYGHTHLRIGGHEVMVADMQLKDDTFWFKGKLNLFPSGWPVRVYGDAEAYISKEKLYLYASTDIELCGLKLARSRSLITHERVRLEGEWLGIYTLVDVQWAGSDPHFKGELSADWSGKLQFGAIYIKGVRVCDNIKLDFRVGFKLALDFDRSGFAATVGATFKIEGVGFSLDFSLSVAPTDLMSLVNQLRDIIAKDAEKYLAHIFSDALSYATAALNSTIEFVEDSYQVIGQSLSHAYSQTVGEIGTMITQLGGTCEDVVLTLCNGAGAGLDTAAQICNSLGHDLGTIATAMRQYTSVIESVGRALNSIGGKTATQIAGALKTAGWDLIATSHGVNAFLNNNWKELLNSLDEAWDDVDVVKCFKNHYRKSMKEIAGWHKELSYAAQKSFDYLKQAWNATEKAVAQVMKDIGRACSQVASLLKKYLGGDAAAQVLKDIGFSKNEVTGAMKTAYNWTTDQVDDWLDKAGSWANTAGGWVNDAGDWLGL